MNFIKTFEKFQYSSDEIRFTTLRDAVQNNKFVSEPNDNDIHRSLENFEGTFILKKGDVIEFREYWVESCWDSLYEKDEYKGLSKYDAMIKFVNERFKQICKEINLEFLAWEFEEVEDWEDWDILKVYLRIKENINESISSIEYRLGEMSDYPSIKKISNQHRNELGFVMKVAIQEAVNKKELYVSIYEGDVIGFVHFHKRKDGWNTIHEIGVDRGFLGKGVGNKLFNMVEKPRRLKTTIDNDKANKFYKDQGMKLVRVEQGKKRKLNVWED